jgi:hypothetical protein
MLSIHKKPSCARGKTEAIQERGKIESIHGATK